MYSVIDLFAGAGGLSLGFQQTKKYSIKVAFENNPAMQATYKNNHPGVDVRGDVCNADYSEIQREYGPIDVVIGDPPCQGFSNANRQKNHAISHNNSLVKEYIRAILEIRPKAFVMENVSMLRSDVHRFYMSKSDIDLVDSGVLGTKSTPIHLLSKDYLFEGIEDLIIEEKSVKKYLWPDLDYLELNVIYKAAQNNKKLLAALEKHKKRLIKIAEEHLKERADSEIKTADRAAFTAVLNYYNNNGQTQELLNAIEPAIMYQRMLGHALEIIENDLVVDNYSTADGLRAEIRSFAVFDYLKALLEVKDDTGGYVIAADVLSAADFGPLKKG